MGHSVQVYRQVGKRLRLLRFSLVARTHRNRDWRTRISTSRGIVYVARPLADIAVTNKLSETASLQSHQSYYIPTHAAYHGGTDRRRSGCAS